MTVYRKERRGTLKWLLALIIFGLALTITFDDVEGSNFSDLNRANMTQNDSYTLSSTVPVESTNPTSSTEKAPLLLVAGFLGVMYAVRRKRA